MTTTTRPKSIDLRSTRLELESPAHVREAAKRALDDGETHYTTRPGLNPLRRAIAEKLARENGVEVHPEREVLVTSGTREALFVALNVLLEPGDEVVVTGPTSKVYRDIARLAGGVTRTAVGDAGSGFALDTDRVAERLTKRTRVLVLTNPSSPAGSVAGREQLDALAALAIDHGFVVVAVETLEPFVHEGVHQSIAALPGMGERTVTINGFSELHGLAGWRVGYAAGPEKLLGPLTQLKQAMSICSAAVSQHAALAAITGPTDAMDAARAELAERRSQALAQLDAAGIDFIRPAAGYHVLLDAHGGEREERELLARLRDEGVRAGGGSAVGAPGWIWIALSRPSDVLAEAIRRMQNVFGATERMVTHV